MAANVRNFQYTATASATAINTGISASVNQSCPQGVLLYCPSTNASSVAIGYTSGVVAAGGTGALGGWVIEPGTGRQVDPANLCDASSNTPSLSNLFVIGNGNVVCVELLGIPVAGIA